MIKIIYRFLIILVITILVFITYLSTVGIKTDKLNNQISYEIKKIDKDLDVELKEVSILLDLFNLRFLLKTVGTNLKYKKQIVQLETIKSKISIKSLLKNKFSLNKLEISTKSIKTKNLISLMRLFTNDPKFFVAEKIVKKGYIISNIQIEFDKNGNIKDNFKINGSIKEGKIDLLKNYNLSKIDCIFNFNKNNFELKNFKSSFNGKNFSIPNAKIQKLKDKFLISGKLNNKDLILKKEEAKFLFDSNIKNLDIDKIQFESENSFTIEVNKKFKFNNLKVNSDIYLKELIILNNDLQNFFPESNEGVKFQNHQIKIDYNNNFFNIEGLGEVNLKDQDKIKYKIVKDKKGLTFDTKILLTNNIFKLDDFNYKKKDKSNLEIVIKGKKDLNEKFSFDKILLTEKDNKFEIENLSLTKDFKIDDFQKVELNFLDLENIQNKISVKRKNKNYLVNGEIFNINKIVDNLLGSNDKKKKYI